jgi:hypothetical protein
MARDNTPWGLLKTMGLQDVQRLEPMRGQMVKGEKKSFMYGGCIKRSMNVIA